MVIIISKKIDRSSKLINYWLNRYGIKTKLFYSIVDVYKIIDILKSDKIIILDRTQLQYDHQTFTNSNLSLCIREEERSLKKYIYQVLKNMPNIEFFNFINEISSNKLYQLDVAKKNNIKTPFSVVIDSLDSFENKNNDKFITKPISSGLNIVTKNGALTTYTYEIKESDIQDIGTFFPSLIQKKIKKKYEVRTFFLYGSIFSAAIFSKSNSNIVDYRDYNQLFHNRYVPYRLPDSILEKTTNLMKDLNLNCGSIDFIRDENGDYIFLEVNPNGEFNFLSNYCNYNLEYKISIIIINILNNEYKRIDK